MKNKLCKKRLKSAYICVLFAAMMILSALFSPAAKATNQAVLDAANSVVRIYAESAGSEYASIGSGFAVGVRGQAVKYIVTNFHVIMDDEDSSDGIYDDIYVVLDNIYDDSSVLLAEIVAYNEAVDFCILKIPPTYQRTPLSLLSATTVQRTQEVYALGFPSVSDEINDDGENLPSTIEDVTITRGVISKTNSKINNAYFLQMDTVINSGNSGGPLVTEQGYCVGINTFGASSGDTTNGAMYIDYTIQAMRDFGVPFTMASGGPEIAVSPPPTEAVAPAPAEYEDEDETGSILLGAALLLGIGGGAAAVIVWAAKARRRRKAHGHEKTQGRGAVISSVPAGGAHGKTIVVPSPARQQKFSLVGVTGVYSGSIFPINGVTVIGRDIASCNIVYPEKTPGISSVHCRVFPGKDCLLIEDLGSTYGTFIKDHTRARLEANKKTPLPEGAGFFLAVEDNGFIVRREGS
ncbi:MAG: trypsin-like peptidase domain-containing protein [Christensenellales bacterium]